jgi:putative glutamine amidotransferase
MISKPRIAIPEPTSTAAAYNQGSLPQYIRAVEAAGGIAVPIPLLQEPAVQASLLALCAAILLPGSPADVDPGRYGQQPVEACAAGDPAREAVDNLLLQDAFELGKPVLGICYGLQSLNVWRRGTLIQDLPQGETTGVVNHQPGREVQDAHPVLVTPGSRLSQVVQEERLAVNSSHHQAIDRPGESLKVAAVSPVDGVIEALEGTVPAHFMLGVQWHPERSFDSSAASRAQPCSRLPVREAAFEWDSGAHSTGVR